VLHCYYTTTLATLLSLLRYHYTVVTLLSHCCTGVWSGDADGCVPLHRRGGGAQGAGHEGMTLVLRCCHTATTLVSRQHYAVVTQLLHCCYIDEAEVPRGQVMKVCVEWQCTLLLHNHYIIATLLHYYHIGRVCPPPSTLASPVYHCSVTTVYQ
jgi:hypothetical protein